MKSEFTGKFDAAATKRFAGKVFDRIVRGTMTFCYMFFAACAALEAMMLVRGGRLDLYPILFFAIVIFLTQKFQRSRFQKAMDGVFRRYMGNSEEMSLVMSDDSYECRCGDNLMRVAWRNLGSHYLFIGDGVAVMEGKLPTLLIPCLAEMGVQADELRGVLARAGLKDYRSLRSYGWLVLFLACVVGGVAVFSGLARGRPQIHECLSCIDEEDEDDDEDEWADDFGSSGRKSFSLGDIDFDSKWIDLDYSLSDLKSQTNKQQISYQDFANIVAVLREQKSRKTVSMFLSIDDAASPARPLDTLATLTNSHLSVDLVLHDCTNLTDVAMLGRVPLKELALIRSPIREIRGLERCPVESLTVSDCPLSSLVDICPLPRLKKMTLGLRGMKVPSKEEVLSRWGKLDLLIYYEPDDSASPSPVVIPLFSETERFQSAIADADRVVIRDGGFGCCTKPERDPVLLVLADPQGIADFRAMFKFEDKGANSSCMCCGHPGIDWWKGDALVARTAVQHLQGLRWKGFYGDASLTPESRKSLGEWFAARNIKAGEQ